MTAEEKISLFCTKIIKSGADVKSVTNPEELHVAISELIQGADSVYCPGISDLEKTITIDPDIRKADYAEAKTTIEEVKAGIAETGTIVCVSSPGKALQASVVTYHHIAIVSRENIFADLDEFFSRVTDPLPTNITFVTGPSRTGDIEQTLSIGVHGPGRVDIIIC
jgi:L-lactate utilization protein LutC